MTSLAQVRTEPRTVIRRATAKRDVARFRMAVMTADVGVILGSLWLATQIRDRWWFWADGGTGVPHLFLSYGSWMALAWLAWMAGRGCYSPRVFGAGSDEFSRVLMAGLLTAGTVAMACYLSKTDLSRGFVCTAFLLGVPVLLGERLAARRVLHAIRSRGGMQRRVLVLGDNAGTSQIAEILHREKHVGYSIVGACVPSGSHEPGSDRPSIPVLGTVDDVREVAIATNVDAVLIAGGAFVDAPAVRNVAWSLEGTDIEMIVVPSLTDVAGPRVHVRPVAGLPLLHIERPQAEAAVRWGKRSFDIIGSLILILVSSPLWLAVACAIKLDDGGPVLFRQRRVGLRGSTFHCLKFRSMQVNAESRRHLFHSVNEADGVLFKIQDDPRRTRVGRFIRRYSLDELPQLLNVLGGQMSLVGPRPPLPEEVACYETNVGRRLLVRPGLTGLWQVSGRSALSWRDTVRLDLYYVDNWSLFSDIVIILRTVRAVLRAEGAA
jgi:exopolysaccharide biosynthesis polyprenyl glycosylphosphotransferase